MRDENAASAECRDLRRQNSFASLRESVSCGARMKVTGLAIVRHRRPQTPEGNSRMLASVLARYSRSNEGLGRILEKVDIANPDESIDRILKFVDYGHASIGGLTGGLAIRLTTSRCGCVENFLKSPRWPTVRNRARATSRCGEQPPGAGGTRLPADLALRWRDVMAQAFAAYHAEYERLDRLAVSEPRACDCRGAKPAVVTRLRKNYALDRARYFIPLATRTNLGLVQSSRMWAATVKHLDSLALPEARTAARLIRDELLKQSPRLMRHSFADPSYQAQRSRNSRRAFASDSRGCPPVPCPTRSGSGSTARRRHGWPKRNPSRSAAPSRQSLWLPGTRRAGCGSHLAGTTSPSPNCAISTATAPAIATRR